MSEIVAVVPVREGSQRVKGKNFRPFADQDSLLSLKIQDLKAANCFSKIYVSSDSERARGIASDHGVDFLWREAELCSSEIRWAPVIRGVAASVPGNPVIAWCHTTSPLFDRYNEAVEAFNTNRDAFDSLVAVRRSNEFILNGRGRPINYTFGPWHDYSQDLETLYLVTGALFIAEKANIVDWSYLIGIRPQLFESSKFEAIDVDDEEDFAIAEVFFHLKADGKLEKQ